MNTLFAKFSQGLVSVLNTETSANDKCWNAHPAFAGVSLKHLVSARDTGGQFSCHLVRIEPGHAIGLHAHPQSQEAHMVMGGSGKCRISGTSHHYQPGTTCLIAAATEHEVLAAHDGLELLAVFSPALC